MSGQLLPDGTIPTDDVLKSMFRQQGINVVEEQPERTEPWGNKRCPCGSGIRYDCCCGVLNY
jgi:uncharacterized protein YchJ